MIILILLLKYNSVGMQQKENKNLVYGSNSDSKKKILISILAPNCGQQYGYSV